MAEEPGEQRGPWRVLGTREVYKNAWVRVREDQVLRPDGKPGIYGVIETQPAVAVVALTEDERVYLVGQYRYPTATYGWEVISGFAEKGEDPLEAARRELREEAGLAAAEWTPLGTGEISNSVTDQTGFVFLARGLTHVPGTPDGTKAITLKLVPVQQALRMAQSSEIVQAFSLAALYRAWHHLKDDLND